LNFDESKLMKKILFLSPLEGMSNGATRSLLSIINYSTTLGYAPILVAPRAGELTKEVRKHSKVYLVDFDWWVRPRYGSFGAYEENFDINSHAVSKLIQIIEKEQPVACITTTATVPWLAYAAAIKNLPHIWHVYEHLTDPSPTFRYRLPQKDLLRTISSLSVKVFAVSQSVKKQLQHQLPDFNNIEVMHIYVPPLSERKAGPAPKILFKTGEVNAIILGNIEPNKGQFDAVKAVHSLIKSGETINLTLVGKENSPIYTAKIKAYIKSNELGDCIKFTGFVNNPSAYLKASDISLICSEQDAFPLVAVESLQLEIPIIASKSGGVQEIISDEGHSGYLYSPGDIDELADKIRLFLKDRNLAASMGQRGKKYVEENFSSIEKVNKPLFKYLGALDQKPTSNSLNLAPLDDLIKSLESASQKIAALEASKQSLESAYSAVVNSRRWRISSKVAGLLSRLR
jgi:glycosyltransferase involved in cell wall biosynthesis